MSVRRSLGLASATRAAVFVITFATVIVVSRVLTPAEIGIFSVSVAAIGIAHVFRDFGVGQYLMQLREVTRERRRAAFTVTLAFSWCIALALWLAKDYVAAFYRHPGVANVMLLLAVNFVILPFGAPLRTLLQREMQFGKLAVVNLSNHLVQSGTTVAAAWAGASYMSMAWGSIAGNLANVVVLLLISPKGALDWPTRHGLGDVLRFGSKASVDSLASAAGGASPDLILGRTLGFSDVAFFSRANGLLSMALGQLMYVVHSVYAPVFAKGFREGRDGAVLYNQTVALLLGITLPTMGLLALLSSPLIALMFGPQWMRSAPLASAICVFAMISAPFVLAPTSLVVSGNVGMMMRCRLLIESARVLMLLVSIAYSLEVVVAAMGLVALIEALVFLRALHSTIGLRAGTLWSNVRKSYGLALFTVAGPGMLFLTDQWFKSIAVFWMLAASLALGALGWLAGLTLLRHPLKAEARTTIHLIGERLRLRPPFGRSRK